MTDDWLTATHWWHMSLLPLTFSMEGSSGFCAKALAVDLALQYTAVQIPQCSVSLQSLQGNQVQSGLAGPRPASPGINGKGAGFSGREEGAAEGVGEEDVQGAQGFHVGLAPANLRPPEGIDTGTCT